MAKAQPKAAPVTTTKPEAAATTEVKKEAVPRVQGPKDVAPTAKITLLATENPKRVGSKSYARFAFYKDQMTVAEALAAGVVTPDLVYDASHGFISIEGYAPKMVPVKEKKVAAEKPKKEPKGEVVKKTAASEGDAPGEELE